MSVACGMECVVVLKGSSHGRTIDKPEGEIDEIITLKDLHLNFVFRLQGKWYHELMKKIDLDCEILEAERIMDYSFLGCMRWVWQRCTYIGVNDSATWTSATPDEFDPVPRVCHLVLAVYEPDLHNPHFIPTCGFRPNPDWVVKRVTYDVR